jgi:hypothetical protein
VRGLKQALTEDDRFAVADDVVAQLKDHGDPWRLAWSIAGESLATSCVLCVVFDACTRLD